MGRGKKALSQSLCSTVRDVAKRNRSTFLTSQGGSSWQYREIVVLRSYPGLSTVNQSTYKGEQECIKKALRTKPKE